MKTASPFDHPQGWSSGLGSTLQGMTSPDPTATADDVLLKQYVAGDAAAFDSLYSRYSERVWRYVFRASGFDNNTAADVCQEIWMKVVHSAPRFRASGRFDRWLFAIAHNAIIDRYRKPDSVEKDVEDTPDLTNFVQRFAVTDELEQALNQLGAEQRSALLLHHVEGYTLDEIATLRHTGRETVKSRVRYGMTTLRRLLGGDHDTAR